MRRYSPSYFISTGIKSLWRNGFMTVASIAILVSCLVVMGAFALLVSNIDYNLENIDGLNQIVAFADVDRIIDAVPEQESESESGTDGEDTDSVDIDGFSKEDETDQEIEGLIIPYVETKPDDETYYAPGDDSVNALFANFEAQLRAFSNFDDLSKAAGSVSSVQAAFDTLTEKINALGYDSPEVSERYKTDSENFEYAKARIEILGNIDRQIKNISGVDASEVSFTSKSAALTQQKEKYEKYVNLYEVLNDEDNPFPDSFTITYTNIDGIDLIQWDLEHIDGIYSVVSRSELAQDISSMKNGVIMIFTWLFIILLFVSIFVIVNTIKIAVHARRDEIGVMRFVGATNFFITTPFVIEGGLIGLISGIAGYFIIRAIYMALDRNISASYPMISLISPSSVNGWLLLSFLGFGVLIGIISSAISIRKYLKV